MIHRIVIYTTGCHVFSSRWFVDTEYNNLRKFVKDFCEQKSEENDFQLYLPCRELHFDPKHITVIEVESRLTLLEKVVDFFTLD